MRIIKTHEVDLEALPPWDRDQCYNGLDVTVCYDVYEALQAQMDPGSARVYDFSRALQGPTMEMRLRGVLVDQVRKQEVIDELVEKIDILESNLEKIVLDGVGMPSFNWRSNDDLQRLFYSELGLPTETFHGRPTTNRAARESLA